MIAATQRPSPRGPSWSCGRARGSGRPAADLARCRTAWTVDEGMTGARGCAVTAASPQGAQDRMRCGRRQGHPQVCSRSSRVGDCPPVLVSEAGLEHSGRWVLPVWGEPRRRVQVPAALGRYHPFWCPRGKLNQLHISWPSKLCCHSAEVHAIGSSGSAEAYSLTASALRKNAT